MLIKTLQSLLPEYSIEAITSESCALAMEVFDSNIEYCMLMDGRAATKDDCIADITAVPEGFDLANKHFVCIRENCVSVGVLDVLAGYPNEKTLYIGLLMVNGNMHRRGVGRHILSALTDAARGLGFTSVQLAVLEGNDGALSFWTREGFSPLEGEPAYANGTTTRVLKMEKIL